MNKFFSFSLALFIVMTSSSFANCKMVTEDNTDTLYGSREVVGPGTKIKIREDIHFIKGVYESFEILYKLDKNVTGAIRTDSILTLKEVKLIREAGLIVPPKIRVDFVTQKGMTMSIFMVTDHEKFDGKALRRLFMYGPIKAACIVDEDLTIE